MVSTNKQERQFLPAKEVIFQGKQIIITGGGSGIGKALAERFSQLGANVTTLDIVRTDQLPVSISQILADVRDKDQLASQINNQNVDILVIAAGVTSQTSEPTNDEQQLMESVNVTGVQNTLDAFGRLLPEGSKVIYIGSDDPPKAFYADTKKRGAQLVKNFSATHPELSVRLVYLGPVRTPLFEKGKPPEVIERIAMNVGLYEPSEFAEELVDDLADQSNADSNLQEKVMYKKIKK